MGAPYSLENKHDRFPCLMCCHLQKNRPSSQKDRRLIKTGRQAGQTFGVRDLGHRGEKIMLHSTFTADWQEASSPFSDSICCSETLDSPCFSSQWHPFPRPILTESWLSGGLAVSTFKPLNKMSRCVGHCNSHWRDRPFQGVTEHTWGGVYCPEGVLLPPLPPHGDWKETELLH